MAVSDWGDTTLNYESSDGTLPSFKLNASDIDLHFSWSNFPSDGATINVDLDARLPNRTDDAGSYATVLSGSFTVSEESGDTSVQGDDIIDGSSFPVSVLTNTPIQESYFAVPSGQSEKTTPVDFRVRFEYDGEAVTRETTCSVTVTETTAYSNSLVENFEPTSGSPAGPYEDGETLSTYYSGDLAPFSRQQSTVKDGSHALEVNVNDDARHTLYLPDSSSSPTGRTPVKGDVFEFYLRPAEVLQMSYVQYEFRFGASSNSDGYRVMIRDGGQGTTSDQAFKLIGDSFSKLDSSASWSTQWYRFEVDWGSDDTISVTCYDDAGNVVSTLSGTDSAYATNTGYAFSTYSNNSTSKIAQWDGINIL